MCKLNGYGVSFARLATRKHTRREREDVGIDNRMLVPFGHCAHAREAERQVEALDVPRFLLIINYQSNPVENGDKCMRNLFMRRALAKDQVAGVESIGKGKAPTPF